MPPAKTNQAKWIGTIVMPLAILVISGFVASVRSDMQETRIELHSHELQPWHQGTGATISELKARLERLEAANDSAHQRIETKLDKVLESKR